MRVVFLALLVASLTAAMAATESTVLDGFVATARGSLLALFGYPNSAQVGDKPAQKKKKSEITSAEVDERVKHAQELIAAQRVDEAMDVLLGVLERVPEDKDGFLPNLLLGTALLTEKKLAGAATGFLYEAVHLSNWTDTVSIANLVAALQLENDTQLAERVAMRGLDIGKAQKVPGSVFVLGQSVAKLYESKGDYATASEWYLSSALENPTESEEPWIRASTMKFPPAHQKLDIAESVLLRAFPHHPNSPEILFLLGSTLHRLDRISQALPIYRRALALDGSRKDLTAMYATALHADGKLQDAVAVYNKALELSANDNNPVLLANFAMCLCETSVGLYDQGRKLVQAARAMKHSGNAAEDVEAASDMCDEEEIVAEPVKGDIVAEPAAAKVTSTSKEL